MDKQVDAHKDTTSNTVQEIVKLLAAKGLTLGEAEVILIESRNYLTQYIIEVTDKRREALLSELVAPWQNMVRSNGKNKRKFRKNGETIGATPE